jgi:hypothetical protein
MAREGALIAAYHRRRQTRQTAQRSCSPAGPLSLPASTRLSWREAVSPQSSLPWAPLKRKPQSPPSCTHTPIRAYAVGARTPKCVFEGVATSPTGGAGHQAAVSRGGGSRCRLTPAGHTQGTHASHTHRVHIQVTHKVHMQVTHKVHMQVTHRVHMKVTHRARKSLTGNTDRIPHTQGTHAGHTNNMLCIQRSHISREHEIHAPVDMSNKTHATHGGTTAWPAPQSQ